VKVLEMLNSDEGVFEFVKQHLIHQGQKAMAIPYDNQYGDNEYKCFYRLKDKNLKCAVGCLIEDQFYDPSMEQKGVIDLYVRSIVSNSLPNWEPNWEMLTSLQEVHDHYEVYEWEDKLKAVYARYFEEKYYAKLNEALA